MKGTQASAMLPRKPCRPASSAPRVQVSALTEDQPEEVVKLSTRVSVDHLRKVLRNSTTSSIITSLSVAYSEMQQQTRELQYPNSIRTAFSCTVLDYILCSSPSVAVWKPLVDEIRKDIFSSIFLQENHSIFFDGDIVDPSGHRFSSFPTHFSSARTLGAQLARLRNEVAFRNSVGKKETLITDQIIKRWQLMLLDRLFSFWRNYTKVAKKKEVCLQKCFGSKKKRALVTKVFSAWSKHTLREKYYRTEALLVQLQTTKIEGEEKLVMDFNKMADSIEAINSEKNTLQEQYKHLQDDLVQAQATVDKLQQRLEQQKAVMSSWRECALQLTSVIRFPPKSLGLLVGPKQLPLPSFSAGDDQASTTTSFTASSSPVRAPTLIAVNFLPAPSPEGEVLHWVNAVLRSIRQSEVSSSSSEYKEITNFGDDFSDGEVLFDLVQFLEIGGVALNQDTRSLAADPTVMAACISALQQFGSCSSLVLTVDDIISCQKPENLRVLLALVMRRASLCPICSPEGISALTSARTDQLDFRTPFEVNITFAKCVSSYRLASTAHSQACGTAVAEAVAASDVSATSAFMDRDLVTELFIFRGLPPPSRVDLDEVSEETLRRSGDFGYIFRCYAPSSFGGTVTLGRLQKLLSDAKHVDKAFSERDVAAMFEFLLQKEPLKPKIASPHLLRPHQRLERGIGIGALVAVFVLLSSKLLDASSSSSLVTRFTLTIERSKKIAFSSGIDEFREIYASPPVQELLAKNSAQLTKMYDDVCQIGSTGEHGITFSQFIALLKETKILEYPLTTEELRKLVEFVTDDSADNAFLSCDMFLQCLVAAGLVKHPFLWIPFSDRLKMFLKKDLSSSTVQPRATPRKK
jgi:hypothetical protein